MSAAERLEHVLGRLAAAIAMPKEQATCVRSVVILVVAIALPDLGDVR
jgi:hypothetical protein